MHLIVHILEHGVKGFCCVFSSQIFSTRGLEVIVIFWEIDLVRSSKA